MNLNGSGLNKAFKTGTEAKAPYYYLTGSLDLTGCPLGTYYFNLDNDFSYANDPIYRRFISVDENVVLSEVTVYSNPPLAVEGEVDLLVRIGGASNTTTSPVVVNWAAPAGNTPVLPPGYSGGPLTIEQVNSGSVNYYGHEGGHFPYYTDDSSAEDLSEGYRFLAITVEEDEGKAVDREASMSNSATDARDSQTSMSDSAVLLRPSKPSKPSMSYSATEALDSRFSMLTSAMLMRPSNVDNPKINHRGGSKGLEDLISRARSDAQPKRRGKGPFRLFPSGNSVISEGRVTVVLKVYPKDQ